VCAKEWRVEVWIGCGKEPEFVEEGGGVEVLGFGDCRIVQWRLFSWLFGGIWFDFWSVGVCRVFFLELFEGFVAFGVGSGGLGPKLSPNKRENT